MLHSKSFISKKQTSRNNYSISLPGLLIVAIFFSFHAAAQGNLLLTPKRVVFEDSKRAEILNLVNTGKDTATYAISFVQNKMKEDGSFEKTNQPDSGQQFASQYLRFFPRTVTLAPGEAQTVKVQVTKTNGIPSGEYRSHLYFRALPNSKPLGEKEVIKDSSISVKIVPVFGISIPVIIRVGENNAAVNFSDVAVKIERDAIPALHLVFNRSGNMSVYGDISVDHVSTQGKVTRVGIAKGLAVYTPNTIRRFRLVLDKKAEVNYQSGKLRIVYADQSPKPVTLAEKEILLGEK